MESSGAGGGSASTDWAQEQEEETLGRIHGHIAGVECQDWSPMGKQAGWQGRTAESFAAWLVARWQRDEDYIIVENVARFPSRCLEELLGQRFALRKLVVSPIDLGVPVHRKRQYMLMVNTQRWRWPEDLADDQSCQEAYMKMFGCSSDLTAQDLCRAPPGVLSAYREECALARGLPHKRSCPEDL